MALLDALLFAGNGVTLVHGARVLAGATSAFSDSLVLASATLVFCSACSLLPDSCPPLQIQDSSRQQR